MRPLTYVFIAGIILMILGPFIPSAPVFLTGLALAMLVITVRAMAWIERHYP